MNQENGKGTASSIDHITVNSIENSSGLFFGPTEANFWRSHQKSNHGIGRISGSHVKGLIGIIQDNDRIDFTNMEENLMIKNASQNGEEANDIHINVNGITINHMGTTASLSTGNNQQDFWRSTSKDNFGTGKLPGINKVESVINDVDDRDLIDQYNDYQSRQVTVQNQKE